MKDIGLIDVWRELNPLKRDYTYFSNPHLLYSRIGRKDILMFARDLHRMDGCSKGIMDLSDDRPVYLKLHLEQCRRDTLWRLNTHILNHMKDQIKKEITEFWDQNDNGDLQYYGMHVKQCYGIK